MLLSAYKTTIDVRLKIWCMLIIAKKMCTIFENRYIAFTMIFCSLQPRDRPEFMENFVYFIASCFTTVLLYSPFINWALRFIKICMSYQTIISYSITAYFIVYISEITIFGLIRTLNLSSNVQYISLGNYNRRYFNR